MKMKYSLPLLFAFLLINTTTFFASPVSAHIAHQQSTPHPLSAAERQAIQQHLKQKIHVTHNTIKHSPTSARTTTQTQTTQTNTAISLPAYNNVGTSDDGNPTGGNFDGGNYSYSAQALQGAGLIPGQNFTYNNVTFVWPNVPAGSPNNYVANGQVLPVTPAVPDAAKLGILGAANGGPTSGTATVTFTDTTTQTFTLNFDDWTLNGGTKTASDSIVATMTYRNSLARQQTINTYLFYTDFAIPTGKTVQSITLPGTVTSGQLHVFAVGVSGPAYNNAGISDNANTKAGNFDGGVKSYSLQSLQAVNVTPGGLVINDGISYPFPLPGAGQNDNYLASGQTLPVVPVANATTLGFLGAAANGNTSGPATITFTDGTSQAITLGFTDWSKGGNAQAAPAFSNAQAVSTPSINTPTGNQTGTIFLFTAEFPIPTGETVQSITLPSTATPGQIHVFAVGTRSAYNNIGTSDDLYASSHANSLSASFDGGPYSYSAQALQQANIVPGGNVVSDGIAYTWPASTPGVANNYQATGQTIAVSPLPNATQLGFLGASHGGNTSGTATVTFTDNSTQTFTLSMTDWTKGGGSGAIASGDIQVASLSYRNNSGGQQTTTTYLFSTEFAIPAGKTVQSVILPTTTSGQIHIFAIGTRTVLNNIGISDDANPNAASFDTGGSSYSYEDFSNPYTGMGWNPGDTITYNGVNFTWPNVPAGQSDNYQVSGTAQTIPVTPVANADTIAFVGASSNGDATGSVKITFTDGTTQTVTLAFSDWTLKGETEAPAANSQIIALLTHRNTLQGQQTIDSYLFYSEVSVTTGKTIQSITLPTTTTGGGSLHLFMVGTRSGGSYPNNVGTSDDTSTQYANFDGQGNSYSIQALHNAAHITPGSDFYFKGVDFSWPNSYSIAADNYQVAGQLVSVTPVANANTLALIGAATNGNQSGTGKITFTDGTTQSLPISLPDWTVQPTGSTYPNISLVASMTYLNGVSGQSQHAIYLDEMEVTVPTTKTIQSITLPAKSTSGGQLHIFAIGTRSGPYNNIGTSDDTAPYFGNMDGGYGSYSAQALQSVGLAPGQAITANGIAFTWPNVTTPFNNNYQAAQQTVAVTPVTNATTLGFLGSATDGNQSGTAKITYTDGSTQTFTLGFADWNTSSVSSLPYGNSVAATMPYRNISGGKKTINTYVFSTSVTLTAGKTVQSVTLPTAPSSGALHIFAIGTK